MHRVVVPLIVGALFALPVWAQESPTIGDGPFFVYMGSFSTKAAAQNHASEFGGWVLRTDLYTDLTPGFYAAVIGPFRERGDAEVALEDVRPIQPDALVRSAGSSRLPTALGDPALLAAVLGELAVVVNADTTTSANPCAPTEPYVTILVGFVLTVFGEEDAPLGGFWMIERTGEVIPIRGCEE